MPTSGHTESNPLQEYVVRPTFLSVAVKVGNTQKTSGKHNKHEKHESIFVSNSLRCCG